MSYCDKTEGDRYKTDNCTPITQHQTCGHRVPFAPWACCLGAHGRRRPCPLPVLLLAMTVAPGETISWPPVAFFSTYWGCRVRRSSPQSADLLPSFTTRAPGPPAHTGGPRSQAGTYARRPHPRSSFPLARARLRPAHGEAPPSIPSPFTSSPSGAAGSLRPHPPGKAELCSTMTRNYWSLLSVYYCKEDHRLAEWK